MSAPNRDQRYRLPPETTLELLAPSKADQPVPLSRRIPPEKLFGGYGDDPRNPVQVASLRMKYGAEAPRRHYPPPPMGTAESPTPAQNRVEDEEQKINEPAKSNDGSGFLPELGCTMKEWAAMDIKEVRKLLKRRGIEEESEQGVELKSKRRKFTNRSYDKDKRMRDQAKLDDWENEKASFTCNREKKLLLMKEVIFGDDVPEKLRKEGIKCFSEMEGNKGDFESIADHLLKFGANYSGAAQQEALSILKCL